MRPLKEIRAYAEEKLGAGGVAASWPIPVMEHGTLRAAVFWYNAAHEPGLHYLYPANRLVILDVQRAEVIRSTPVESRELGLDWPATKMLEGSIKRQVASVDELVKLQDRLDVIAPRVWDAFADGRTALEPERRAEVAEYVRIIEKIEPGALMPYYQHIGKAFYDWTKQVQGGTPR